MIQAEKPASEKNRLETLRKYEILDTISESDFDDITKLAATICDVPICLITFVDEDRQWFKSRFGFSLQETSRDISFCAHAILDPKNIFTVKDTLKDSRFFDNKLVTGEPNIRFYAGAPLNTPSGDSIGTLCVIDKKPKKLNAQQEEALKILSKKVVSMLELRLALKEKQGYQLKLEITNQDLEESERKYRSVSHSVPALLWVSGTDRLCIDFNENWLNFTGRTKQQECGNGWVKGIHPDDIQHCMDTYISNFDARKSFEMEYRLKRHDGEYRWLLDRGTPNYGLKGEFLGYVGICLDITGQKNAEKSLESAVIKLNESNEELEKFAYICSHDLKEPIRNISSLVELLERRLAELDNKDDKISTYLNFISGASTRISGLVNDILEYSKVEKNTPNFEIIDINLTLQKVLNNIETIIERNAAKVECEILPKVYGADINLVQIFQNLLVNSIKFKHPERDLVIKITSREVGHNVEISIEDNGIGIDQKYFSKIFDIFQQLDRKKGGSGIGLSIVKKAVEKMNGKIWLESELGVGTKFIFTVPKPEVI